MDKVISERLFLFCLLPVTILVATSNWAMTASVVSSCPDKDCHTSFNEDSCCCGDEEPFKLGHEPLKYFKECSVLSPKDESMPYAESFWNLYDCMISKSLDSKPVTLTSYGELMAKNLSPPRKSAILSLMQEDQSTLDAIPMQMNDDMEKEKTGIALLKAVWKSYFDAEYQVCKGVSKADFQKMNTSSGERFHYDPTLVCKDTIYPNIPMLPMSIKVHEECMASFKKKLVEKGVTVDLYYEFYGVCRIMGTGLVSDADLESKLDYEALLTNRIIPNFISTRMKEEIFNSFPKVLSKYVRINVQSLTSVKDVLAKLEADGRRILKDFNVEPTDFLMNLFILDDLFAGIYFALEGICS